MSATQAALATSSTADAVRADGANLVAADQLSTTVDAGPYLRPGANTITVEVATTLLNRLRAGDVAYATAKRQAYGLIGPVKVTPYGESTVCSRTDAPGTVGGSVPATLSPALGAPVSFGAFSLPSPLEVAFSTAAWTAPVANDPVTIAFKQHVGATDPLRTGAHSRTLTFTLSTTTP